MKKNFLYSVMALFVCLFAACSQEEIVSDGEQGSNKVSLSVKIPAVGPVSRAASDLPVEGYVMRCIMELVDDKGDLIAGSRKIVAVANGNALFEFTKPSGAYTCLFWADYVKGTDINDTKATIYKAESLKAIDYRLNKTNDLFNNKVADAFCGKLASTAISSGQNVILKRPFTKIAISKADLAKVDAQLNTFTANINSAQGYNIATGKTTTIQTLGTATDSKVTFPTDGETAFSCYVFPANDLVIGNTDIRFTKDGDVATQKKVSITADQMKEMKPNVAVNLVPKEETPGEPGDDIIKVEIEVDNSFENGGGTTDPETPPTDPEIPAGAAKVGDYFYADGTWGTATSNASGSAAVGVVFDLATDDVVANYPNVGLTKINGWVVALTDTEVVKWYSEAALAAAIDGVVVLGSTNEGAINTELLGYANSTAIAAATGTFPANEACKAWSATVPETTSKWYMPSIGQIKRLQAANSIITPKLTAASGTEVASGVYLSSTLYSKPESGIINPMGVLLKVTNPADSNYGIAKAQKINSNYSARAILTF